MKIIFISGLSIWTRKLNYNHPFAIPWQEDELIFDFDLNALIRRTLLTSSRPQWSSRLREAQQSSVRLQLTNFPAWNNHSQDHSGSNVQLLGKKIIGTVNPIRSEIGKMKVALGCSGYQILIFFVPQTSIWLYVIVPTKETYSTKNRNISYNVLDDLKSEQKRLYGPR